MRGTGPSDAEGFAERFDPFNDQGSLEEEMSARSLMELTRREMLTVMASAGVATFVGVESTTEGEAMADSMTTPPAYRGSHEPKPLPFDPSKLRGLSEKLLRSHHENNYTGAVKRLNLIQQQLGQMPKDAPPYQTGSLKREELIATNSMVLHEFYFGNLGGDGKPSGTIADLITAQYGSMGTWEQEFRQTGLSLAGGSGWIRTRRPRTLTGCGTTRTVSPGARRCSSWICTSTRTRWTTARTPRATSTPSSRTSSGTK